MNIGVKQYLLLKRCIDGKVTVCDAREIFNFPDSHRPKYAYARNKRKRPLVELEKLEAYGLLRKDNKYPAIFSITDKGIKKVEEWSEKH